MYGKKAKFLYKEHENWIRERVTYDWINFQWVLRCGHCSKGGIAIAPRKWLPVGTIVSHHSGWSEILSKNETCTFSISGMPPLDGCYYVQCRDAGTDYYYWFKEGIGIVKIWRPSDQLLEEYYDYGP